MKSGAFRLDQIAPLSRDAGSVGLAGQVMSADLMTREDGRQRGVRCVMLQNDILALEVLVDRGLDIGAARIRQMPVAWNSPTGIVAPWLLEQRDMEFFRGFTGGLLATCGLDHIGHPLERSAGRFGYDHRPAEQLPMHGRIGAIPARLDAYGIAETEEGLEAFVAGTVAQVAVFGEHLELRRRISISYGSPRVRIADRVANRGYAASPLAVLYHVNLGWPVIAPGALIEVAGTQVEGNRIGNEIAPPLPGRKQDVCIYTVEPDGHGIGSASVLNPRVDERHSGGVRLEWAAAALPSLVRWQVANTAGHYVLGLEPSTGRYDASSGALVFPTLEPGEARTLGIEVELGRDRLAAGA